MNNLIMQMEVKNKYWKNKNKYWKDLALNRESQLIYF